MNRRRTAFAALITTGTLALVAPAAPHVVPTPATTAASTQPSAEAAPDIVQPPAPPGSAASAALGPARYYYASAQSQYVRWGRGARATLSVHAPRQVNGYSDHSLAELVVRGPDLGDFIEAGWRMDSSGTPRLFVYWWKNNRPQCYNGCGWVNRGHGLKPGDALKPGTEVALRWAFHRGKWWLVVNGKRAGYYPRWLWNGTFRRPRLVQVYGEVVTRSWLPCADMGNGRPPWRRDAAKIRWVNFVDGPRLRLRKTKTSSDYGYRGRLPHDRLLRYGGRGLC